MSEIQHKLDLLADEDKRAGGRNRELFLRHTTLSGDQSVNLDDSALRTSAGDRVSVKGQSLRESSTIDSSVRGSSRDVPRPTSARPRSSMSRGGVVASRGPKESIFEFISGLAGDETFASRVFSPGWTSEACEKAALPGVSSKLFDFDALLDSISSPARQTGPVAAAPIDSPVEATPGLDPLDKALDDNVDEPGDSNSDHELELLLAAKRAARREQQQQIQATEPRRSASARDHAREEHVDRSEPGKRGMGDKKRKSASIWKFGDRMAAASNGEEAEVGGGNAGDNGDDDVEGNEDDALMDDRALQDECERDTGTRDTGDQDQEDERDDDGDNLSIDLYVESLTPRV